MQAIRYHEYGGPNVSRLEEAPRPQPKADEILVRVVAAAINPVDWKIRLGALNQVLPITFPFTMGCDLAGTIEQGGNAGEEVYGFLALSHCGAFAEYAIAFKNEIAPKPKTLSLAEAASIPVASLTAWEGLFEHGQLQKDQTILIHGAAGSVGSMAVQLAKNEGARVIGTGSAADQDYLRELGADITVDYRQEHFEDKVHDVDLVFDTVGGETLERSYAVIRRGGALVTTAGFPAPDAAAKYGVRAQPMSVSANGPRLVEIGKLVDSGKLKFRLDRTFPLSQGLEALAYAESGKPKGKVVIEKLK